MRIFSSVSVHRLFFFFGAVLDNSSLVELAGESDRSGGAGANCGAIICTGEDLIP